MNHILDPESHPLDIPAIESSENSKDNQFTSRERATIIAAHETLHFYDLQHNKLTPTYEAGDAGDAYANDTMEINAKTFQNVAARELGLGTQNRGHRK